jgi:hypothetical protein
VISKDKATAILFQEAARAAAGYVEQSWAAAVEDLSRAAESGKAQTHVAFLGTAILAKCTDPSIDVFSVKERSGPYGYSARNIAKDVWARNAPELDINLGVTSPEPLQNQPYTSIDRVSRDIQVRSTARPVVHVLCDILDRLQAATQDEARQALRAFISVRRQFGHRYSTRLEGTELSLSAEGLARAAGTLVAEASEGGRRAQAVVAGLLDVFAGEDRIDTRRVNDPSRKVPGDVKVRTPDGSGWERIFEVRDKPITREDLYVLATRCAAAGVPKAVMVAVAPNQGAVPLAEAQAWAAERGVTLVGEFNWKDLVDNALLWSSLPTRSGAALAAIRIERRLIDLEASPAAIERWHDLIGSLAAT